jgi:peptide/nickel transport system ATP-binding protein
MSDQVDIKDLTVTFLDENHKLTVIKDLSLSVKNGETLAIIGESGSGKSVLGLAILRLLSESALVSGSIYFQNLDLLTIDEKLMQKIRGRKIAYIPQNPKLAFNPSMKMWVQLSEPMVIHTGSSWSEAKKLCTYFSRTIWHFPSEKCARRPNCI